MAEEASTSETYAEEGPSNPHRDLYITHQISKLDTLAGLAVRYHVTVADIKRANGLLSDTAMFAKDTLLIPTRSMQVGPEYSTWAGMIVAQYGRIPGDVARGMSFGGSSPPKQSPSLDMLQQYYGTGDTASEPSDFRPGDPEGYQGSANGVEIEMTDMDPTGSSEPGRRGQGACPGSIEYAGSRSGNLADERLRRRKAGDMSANSSPLRGSEGEDRQAGNSPEPLLGGADLGANGRPPGGHRRALTQSQQVGRRESIIDRLKRVASQPALAIPQPTSISRIGEVVFAPLADSLPPLPPGVKGSRERPSTTSTTAPASAKGKEVRKAD